jgi:hypothetical protein
LSISSAESFPKNKPRGDSRRGALMYYTEGLERKFLDIKNEETRLLIDSKVMIKNNM